MTRPVSALERKFLDVVFPPVPSKGPWEKIGVVVRSVLVGVATLGLAHLIGLGLLAYHRVSPVHPSSPEVRKTGEVAKERIPTPSGALPSPIFASAFQPAHNEFKKWADGAEKARHFKPGQAKYIVEMFDNACNDPSPLDSLKVKLQREVKAGKITMGNSNWIQVKAGQCLKHRGVVPASTSLSIDIDRIQNLAQQHGYIWFYKSPENDLTACFGNFFEVPGGVLDCRTAEGAYQALKLSVPFQKFANLSGEEAWREAQKIRPLGPQADTILCMRYVLAAKYRPGTELAKALVATGDAYLVEHSSHGNFWTDGGDGTGQNMLGRLLMERRVALKSGNSSVPVPDSPVPEYPRPDEYLKAVKPLKAY